MKLRRFLYGALLTLQAGLVLTGGAVRITGSGLGCPTWPECTPGSYTPVPHQAEGQLHAWIEFGNRLLTFALVAVSLAILIHVLNKRRRDLRSLAIGQLLGILGQGVLGGITVLTDLHPLPVAGHLLLSIILIAGAASLYSRREYSARPRTDLDKLTKRISLLHIGLTFVVIILGTIVTGSGPHAGDEKAQRFGFDIRVVAWLHADAVIALLGLTAAFFILVRSDKELVRRIGVFTAIALAQGAIGYIQYFTGIPEILVAAHLLGATLVWIAAWRIRITVTKTLVIQ
ncbi:COX15/CtaA family protein [Candidatus Planktophila lacus]|jgi:cytochrome c oxidase assembly protein subunit 15|uniref:Cytochrome c oxidase assembly protein subunit 15 n=1 Tax=Candidatus Planktophila lacus TaxID=1884913 RepID=A0AAC9YR05_9ACTN|nr:COX15/CtaA family protein [Candidatus Planktophila lacus]ASY10560.1 cytochrome c oxidase assembly protein subunit 15 [Candidatus Planktophila lacus]ASY25017.1 cytochrome c oxidase assembly protein subunit 15 [Candidatus Planktophila lacus]